MLPMTLEEYTEKVREFLRKQLDEEYVIEKMGSGAIGIKECYEDDIPPEATGAALIKNFI